MKGNMGKIKTLLRVLAISAAALSAAAKAPNRVLDGFSETGKFAKIDLYMEPSAWTEPVAIIPYAAIIIFIAASAMKARK